MAATDSPIKIDIAQILAARLGKRKRYVPRFLVHAVERLIHQDELNHLLESNFPKRGAAFCEGVLDELGVRLNVVAEENLPASPRCIIVSNHPLGGLDGITMIAWLSRHYGNDVHFVVNDLLMAVEPLSDCFVPINKHGSQSRSYAGRLDEVLAGDGPVVIYPAGLVSRLGDDGRIADLAWQKMVVNKAIESRRDIVPVHFDGRNSDSFYRSARLRKKLGIKFNLEMVLLPRELFRSRGCTFTLTCGEPVAWTTLKGGRHASVEAADLRRRVYQLPHNNTTDI